MPFVVFQPLCAVKHDINNSKIRNHGSNPLSDRGVCGYSADKNSGPENDFAKIIRTPDDAVQTFSRHHVRTKLLLFGFLCVSCRFQQNSGKRNCDSDQRKKPVCGVVDNAEQHRADLCRIQNRNTDPDGNQNKKWHLLFVVFRQGIFCNIGLAERSIFQFPHKQESGKSYPVKNEQRHLKQNQEKRRFGWMNQIKNQDRNASARHGKAITDGKEINKFIKSDCAQHRTDGKKNAKQIPRHRQFPLFPK